MPSADSVVRACLNAIPVAIDAVATIDDVHDVHRLDIKQMRLSRQAKDVVNAARPHLDELTDTALAEELRAWMAITTRIA